ncbi:hypothetical protein [Brevibacterium linens]|uniref:hypothetical protein n=1 Tax=Brevibacterium linens TaxID=1703 RepID=UPI003BF610F4
MGTPVSRRSARFSLIRGLDSSLDRGENTGPEEVSEAQVEDGEACIEQIHIALMARFGRFIGTVRAEVELADTMDFHCDGCTLVPKVVSADESA